MASAPEKPDSWENRVAALAKESSRAYLIALRIVGSPALAEEAVQESYAKLLLHPPKLQAALKDDGYPQAVVYLFKTVRGTAIDLLRATRNRKEREDEYAVKRDAAGLSPEEVMEASEIARAARSALSELPQEEREAVSLCCEQDLPRSTVSAILDVPEITVYDRMQRGLDKLRLRLAAQGFASLTPVLIGERLCELGVPPAPSGVLSAVGKLVNGAAHKNLYAAGKTAAAKSASNAASMKIMAGVVLLSAAASAVVLLPHHQSGAQRVHNRSALAAQAAPGGLSAASGPNMKWKNGPGNDPSYFPIGVWMQDPALAEAYKRAGFNVFVGLPNGPTEEQLAALRAANMRVICQQNAVALAHRNDSGIIGWLYDAEAGDAAPDAVAERCRSVAAADLTRPVLLNLGLRSDYSEYLAGGDIAAFDLKGVVRGTTPSWDFIKYSIGTVRAPAESDAWLGLIGGSRGLIWYVQPGPGGRALFDDPELLDSIRTANRQIMALAPVLNEADETDGVAVDVSDSKIQIAATIRRHSGATYLFAAEKHWHSVHALFRVRGLPSAARVEVLDENRSLIAEQGRFSDDFSNFGVHRYRITGNPPESTTPRRP